MFMESIGSVLYGRTRTEDVKTQDQQQHSAPETNPMLKSCDKIGDQCDAESSNEPVAIAMADAKAALLGEIFRFIDHFHKQPDAVHVHPIFGPLGAEEWYRAQFKHCYHHLQQFGLIGQFENILS